MCKIAIWQIPNTLLPFAMESLGKIGKQGYEYINQVAADYGEHYKVATMKRYWFRKISVAIGQTVSNIMNDWLNGKSRDEEQIQDDIDKYQMMDCRIHTGYYRYRLYKGTPRKVVHIQFKLRITCYSIFFGCTRHANLIRSSLLASMSKKKELSISP